MPSDNILITYTLQPEDEGKKFEQILFRRFHLSRKLLQKIKTGENAWADGQFVFLNTRGRAGQTLVIRLFEQESSTVRGENLPLNILYEDDLFLAVNKPAGQVVHPTSGYFSGTLANAVVGYWEKNGDSRPFRPIFRIDKDTSGIVLIALNRFAHQQLSRIEAEKKYLGLVTGSFPYHEGLIDSPIRLRPGSRIVREIHPAGQPAGTIYKTLQRFKDYSLLEFTLLTGRTHQIRVHCRSMGHPLLGDEIYGGDRTLISRQALHSYSYSFIHPLKNRRIIIQAPLPDDIESLLKNHNIY